MENPSHFYCYPMSILPLEYFCQPSSNDYFLEITAAVNLDLEKRFFAWRFNLWNMKMLDAKKSTYLLIDDFKDKLSNI